MQIAMLPGTLEDIMELIGIQNPGGGGLMKHSSRDVDDKSKPMRTIVFCIILWTQGCEKIAMDKDFPLYVHNRSSHSVSVYLNDNENHSAVYPDTTISSIQDGIVEIPKGEKKAVAGGSASWDSVFKVSVPNDTLSLIVFHTDTLSKYPWTEIREEYKILKRYDLSLSDLERLDFTVAYPPDASMTGIKMYPPE